MEVFKTFDADGKGFINKNDLARVLKLYNENLTEAEVT